MKVLLISANTETSPYPVYPLGIDYVAGAIGKRHAVFVADMNEMKDDATLKARIESIGPDIIGISIRNIDNTDVRNPKSYINHHKSMIRSIRKLTPALVVLGGSGFTLFPGQLMDALQADYGIIGEGERFQLFLDACDQKTDISGLEGVIKPGASLVDTTPPPVWNGPVERRFNPHSPHIDHYLKMGGMLNLQTKRGCPFKCIYCTYPHIEGRQLRRISPSVVAETALKLQSAGAKYLFITDSVFNSDYDHSLAVARGFQKAGLTIPWSAYIAPTRPPADYFKVLAGAGMTHAEFGTEAFSDAILTNFQKPFRTADIFFSHREALEAGLNTAHFFLPGAPAETRQTLNETLDNAALLEKTVCFFFAGIRVYPHTGLHEIALASGQVTKEQDLLIPYFYQPEGIKLEEIKTTIETRAQGRLNWVFGAGGGKMTQIIARLHARGHAGPLWEHLIR